MQVSSALILCKRFLSLLCFAFALCPRSLFGAVQDFPFLCVGIHVFQEEKQNFFTLQKLNSKYESLQRLDKFVLPAVVQPLHHIGEGLLEDGFVAFLQGEIAVRDET